MERNNQKSDGMKQPTNLELALCDQLPWGLKMKYYDEELRKDIRYNLNFATLKDSIKGIAHDRFVCKPYFFDLSCLIKEITIKDYNDGEPFVPIKLMEKRIDLNTQLFNLRYDTDTFYLWNKEGGYAQIADCQSIFYDTLDELHFNRRNLKPHEFINAYGLNIY